MEIPTIAVGLVRRIEIDFCQDGATYTVSCSTKTTRVRPANREVENFLAKIAGSRQDVAVVGPVRHSVEGCKYLFAYYAGDAHGALAELGGPQEIKTLDAEGSYDVATGVAAYPDFEGALEAAVRNLPTPGSVVDYLLTAEVTRT